MRRPEAATVTEGRMTPDGKRQALRVLGNISIGIGIAIIICFFASVIWVQYVLNISVKSRQSEAKGNLASFYEAEQGCVDRSMFIIL